MAPKDKKTAYEDELSEARKMVEGVEDKTLLSLEEILAEYGGSRQQRLLADVEQATEPVRAVVEAESAPSESVQTEAVPETVPAPALPVTPRLAKWRSAQKPTLLPQEPSVPEKLPAVPNAELSASELPPTPKPISMEEVVSRTVDSVIEEQQEELLPPRRGLFSRRKFADTEEIYSRPEEPAPAPLEPEEPPIGPEEPAVEMAAMYRSRWKRQSRRVPAAFLVSLLLLGLTAVDELGVTIPIWSELPQLRTGVLLLGMLAVCILCRSVFAWGGELLTRKRCSGELLISLSAVVAAADAAASLLLPDRTPALPYGAVVCLGLTAALWGDSLEDRGQYDAYRIAADPEPPYLVTDTPRGACKQRGLMEGFYTDAEDASLPRIWQAVLLPVVLVGGFVFAGLASFGQQRQQDFLLCWSAILTASAALGLPLSWGLPWARTARQLQKNGCALAGYGGTEKIGRRREVILTDMDLFPPGAMRLNGVKVYGEELPRAASYAASLAQASGSGGLIRLFDGLMRSEGSSPQEVSDFSFYEEGGFSGVIRGETILMGTASFLRKMEVRLPGNLNLQTGVYLAVDRQLTAVFAVKYEPSENVDWALRMLRRSRISPILAARDANITPALLRRKFNRKVRVEYPDLSSRVALSEQEDGSGRPRALLYREGLLPYAETVAGSRRLLRATRWCALLSLLGSVCGSLLAFYLASVGSFSLMSPLSMTAFLLLWLLPVLLVSFPAGRF